MSDPNNFRQRFRLSPSSLMVLGSIQVEGGLAIVALILGWFFSVPIGAAIQWEGEAVLRGILAAFPIVAACWILYRLRWKSINYIRRFLNMVYYNFIRHCSILQLFLIALLAGLGEELFFRGFLQTALIGWISSWGVAEVYAVLWGVLLSAMLFALVHPISRLYFFVCFLIGVYCSFLFLWTDNLLVPIVFHAFYDFIVLVFWRQFAGKRTVNSPCE